MSTVTIELATDKNATILFPPTQSLLRGRHDWANVTNAVAVRRSGQTPITKMPTIPGLHIELDVTKKCARIYDPLSLPENESLLNDISSVWASNYGKLCKPKAEEKHKDMSQNQVATWFHWMRRYVDANMARLVSGDIKQTVKGRVRVDFFNNAQTFKDRVSGRIENPKYKDEMDYNRDLAPDVSMTE